MGNHELDERTRIVSGGTEPGVVPGTEPEDTSISDIVVRTVQRWRNEKGEPFSQADLFLGLGAGEAYPEMQIVDRLGFSAASVTLVDKRFSQDAKSRFSTNYPQTTLVESGLFEFLDKSPERGYSLVTALGVEHSLNIPHAMDTFISALPKVMKPGGIAVVFPYKGTYDPSAQWTTNDFEPLYPHTKFTNGLADAMMYVYRGKPQATPK